MRNLSLEAAKLAEEQLILVNPPLANKQFREQLTEETKLQISHQLLMLATWYEASLIQELTNPSQSVY